MKRASWLLSGALALGGVSALSSAASAAVLVDFRFSDGTKSKPIAAGTYSVDVWAQVTGANATSDEGLVFLYGSIQSTTANGGTIKPGTSGVTANEGTGIFTTVPARGQSGTAQSVGGDGVQDWGATTTSNTATIKYNSAVDAGGTTPATRDSAGGIDNDIANGVEFKVGTFTVTINPADANLAAGANALTSFGWVKATGTFPTPHNHRIDGSSTAVTNAAAYTTPTAANSVNFTPVPEPTLLGLAGLAGLALRRRR